MSFYKISGTSNNGYTAGSAVSASLLVIYPFQVSSDWYIHGDIGGNPANWVRLAGGPYASQADALDVIDRLSHDIDAGSLA